MLDAIQTNFDRFFNEIVDGCVKETTTHLPYHVKPKNSGGGISQFFKSLVEEPLRQLDIDITKGIRAYNFRATVFNVVTCASIATAALAIGFLSAAAFGGGPGCAGVAAIFAIASLALFALRELINNNIEGTLTAKIVQYCEPSSIFKKLIPTEA